MAEGEGRALSRLPFPQHTQEEEGAAHPGMHLGVGAGSKPFSPVPLLGGSCRGPESSCSRRAPHSLQLFLRLPAHGSARWSQTTGHRRRAARAWHQSDSRERTAALRHMRLFPPPWALRQTPGEPRGRTPSCTDPSRLQGAHCTPVGLRPGHPGEGGDPANEAGNGSTKGVENGGHPESPQLGFLESEQCMKYLKALNWLFHCRRRAAAPRVPGTVLQE